MGSDAGWADVNKLTSKLIELKKSINYEVMNTIKQDNKHFKSLHIKYTML